MPLGKSSGGRADFKMNILRCSKIRDDANVCLICGYECAPRFSSVLETLTDQKAPQIHSKAYFSFETIHPHFMEKITASCNPVAAKLNATPLKALRSVVLPIERACGNGCTFHIHGVLSAR